MVSIRDVGGSMEQFKGTTIIVVRRNNQVALGGDGQVSFGNTILKSNAKKVRRLLNNQVLAGFAGGQLMRSPYLSVSNASLKCTKVI